MYNNKRDSQEELYSQSISAGKRKYFVDVKQTRGGDKYITIAESRKVFDNETGQFSYEKSKLFLYKEDFDKFLQGLNNAFSFIQTGEIPDTTPVDFGEEVPATMRDRGLDSATSEFDNIDFNI